jgi:hypothetical protein
MDIDFIFKYLQDTITVNQPLAWGILIFFCYWALCQSVLGNKIGIHHNWMAFIPPLNVFHFCRIARKPGKCFFLLLIPLVNLFVLLYLFAEIARACRKSAFLGILLMIPPLTPLIFGYLAFSSSGENGFDEGTGKHDSKVVLLITLVLCGFLVAGYVYVPEIKEKIHYHWNNTQSFCKKILKLPGKNKKVQWMLEDQWMLKKDTFYTYKDDKGTEHVVSAREDIPEKYRNQSTNTLLSTELNDAFKIMTKEEEAGMLAKLQGAPVPEQLKDAKHKVFIYTFDGDPYREDTKNYFNKFHVPYKILDVKNPEFASELKLKLGLDPNKKYADLLFPIVEINGQLVERVVDQIDSQGTVTEHSLNMQKINKMLGLRASYEG